MDGYSVTEAASVLGVPTERVWELLARGVLAGTPEGDTGMRVFLQPRPGPPPMDTPLDPPRTNGNGGREATTELSPFRELLTEFRNLTERYGQALLALGEARGEVASLRSRVDVLEARMDLRLPTSAPGWPTTPSARAPEPVREETEESLEESRRRRRHRAGRPDLADIAEALARADDPSPSELPRAAPSADLMVESLPAEGEGATAVLPEPPAVVVEPEPVTPTEPEPVAAGAEPESVAAEAEPEPVAAQAEPVAPSDAIAEIVEQEPTRPTDAVTAPQPAAAAAAATETADQFAGRLTEAEAAVDSEAPPEAPAARDEAALPEAADAEPSWPSLAPTIDVAEPTDEIAQAASVAEAEWPAVAPLDTGAAETAPGDAARETDAERAVAVESPDTALADQPPVAEPATAWAEEVREEPVVPAEEVREEAVAAATPFVEEPAAGGAGGLEEEPVAAGVEEPDDGRSESEVPDQEADIGLEPTGTGTWAVAGAEAPPDAESPYDAALEEPDWFSEEEVMRAPETGASGSPAAQPGRSWSIWEDEAEVEPPAHAEVGQPAPTGDAEATEELAAAADPGTLAPDQVAESPADEVEPPQSATEVGRAEDEQREERVMWLGTAPEQDDESASDDYAAEMEVAAPGWHGSQQPERPAEPPAPATSHGVQLPGGRDLEEALAALRRGGTGAKATTPEAAQPERSVADEAATPAQRAYARLRRILPRG